MYAEKDKGVVTMKKIGLVCNYYILNYGSALQCYATERAVQEMGGDIEGISFPNIPTKKAKTVLYLCYP